MQPRNENGVWAGREVCRSEAQKSWALLHTVSAEERGGAGGGGWYRVPKQAEEMAKLSGRIQTGLAQTVRLGSEAAGLERGRR